MTAKEHLRENAKRAAERINGRRTLVLVSNCCGAKLWSNSAICPNCKEWCKPVPEGVK